MDRWADKAPWLLGILLPSLLALNIFTTRAELAEYKAYVAEHYVKLEEQDKSYVQLEQTIAKRMERIEQAIDRLDNKVEQLYQRAK